MTNLDLETLSKRQQKKINGGFAVSAAIGIAALAIGAYGLAMHIASVEGKADARRDCNN